MEVLGESLVVSGRCCVAAPLRRFHLFGNRHRLFLEECHWRPIAEHIHTDPVPDAVRNAAKRPLVSLTQSSVPTAAVDGVTHRSAIEGPTKSTTILNSR